MENILNGLQSGAISDRTAALEKLTRRLSQGKPLQEKPDKLVKLISHTVSNLRDANVKIVSQSLNVMQMFMDLHPESFPTLINLCFDLLMTKYSDGKAAIRNKATEVVVELIGMTDLVTGYDRLYQQIQHSGKSVRVKEQIIYTLLLLHSTYGEEVLQIPDLLMKLGGLLGDSTASVRNLAVDAIATLHAYVGDQMLLELEAQGVRTDRVIAVQDAVVSESYLGAMEPVREVALALLEKRQSIAREVEYKGGKYGVEGGLSPDGTTLSGESFGSVDAIISGRPSSGQVDGFNHDIYGRTLSTDESIGGGMPRGDSEGSRGGKESARPVLRRAKTSNDSASKRGLSATMGTPSFMSSPSNSSSNSHSSNNSNYCQYDPRHYLELLRDGPWPQPTRLYSEKDLQREATRAVDLCDRTVDWQDRMRGLSTLQALALGDALEYEREFVSVLRRNHDTLIAQISDLRSVLSKEGCRTVSILARRLGPSFHPLVDLLVPPLLKLLLLKIKIMSGAADRTIRIIVSTSSSGYPRMLPHLLEHSLSKNSVVRRSCFEYLSMCCALWRGDVLEKQLSAICRAIRPGISDADSGVRRAARHTFWVLEQRTPFHNTMQDFMESLEVAAQRHLQKELQDSLKGDGEGDLEYLFMLMRDALPPFSPDIAASLAILDDGMKLQNEGSENERRENLLGDSEVPMALGTARKTFPPRRQFRQGNEDSGPAVAEESHAVYELEENLSAERQLSSSVGGPDGQGAPPVESPEPAGDIQNTKVSNFSVLSTAREDSSGKGDMTDAMTVATSISAPGGLEGTSNNAKGALTALKARRHAKSRLGGATRVPVAPSGVTKGAVKSLNRGAQRVQIQQPDATPSTSATPKDRGSVQSPTQVPPSEPRTVSVAEVAAAFCPSLGELRRLVKEEAWTARLQALVAIGNRLRAANSQPHTTDPNAHHNVDSNDNLDILSSGLLTGYVEVALERLSDVHQRVALEAHNVVQLCVDRHGHSDTMKTKLGALLMHLFHRLGDKRVPVRERANALLNSVRLEFEPVTVVAALSPRILDLPERTKTAVMQFLCVTVPHCGSYFQEGKHTWAFLGRMACVLGATGSKPSASLKTAGSRLLELVYKSAPTITLLQLSLLPLGQQELLKRHLEVIEPNIDALVSTAGREVGDRTPPLPKPPGASATETLVAPMPSSTSSVDMPKGTDDASLTPPVRNLCTDESGDESRGSTPVAEQPLRQQSTSKGTPVQTTAQSSPISSPRAGNAYVMPSFEDAALSVSPPRSSPGAADSPAKNLTLVEAVLEGRKSPHTQMRASPVTVAPSAKKNVIQGVQNPPKLPVTITTEGSKLHSANVDMAWLLEALSPSGQREEKKEAVKVLRHLARTRDKEEDDTAWWSMNCAQIVSVLLESLSPHQASAVGDANVYGADAIALADNEAASTAMENMHTTCKVLLLLVKYRAQVMLNLCELLAAKLCQSATFAPISVTLHCEQILMDLAKLDGRRMLKLILPFSRETVASSSMSGAPSSMKVQPTPVKLLALHVIAGTLKCVPSSVLLAELPSLVESSLPSLSSEVVDLRKAVIFVLVEAYMVVGDALYPFVKGLAPPQRKLLTIYIDRQLESKVKNRGEI